MQDQKQAESIFQIFKWKFIAATIGVLAVWTLFAFLPFYWLTDMEVASQFGGSFGFVSALFTALAFAGVIAALLVQIQEFRHQQQESEQSHRHEQLTTYLEALSIQYNNNDEIINRKGSNEAKRFRLKLVNQDIRKEIDQIVEELRPAAPTRWKRPPVSLSHLESYVLDLGDFIVKCKLLATRNDPLPPVPAEKICDELYEMKFELHYRRQVNDPTIANTCLEICEQITAVVDELMSEILYHTDSLEETGPAFDKASKMVTAQWSRLSLLGIPKSKQPDTSPLLMPSMFPPNPQPHEDY